MELGRKVFMLMGIDPRDVPLTTDWERKQLERGFYRTKIAWRNSKNPLIPECMRDVDRRARKLSVRRYSETN